MTETQLFDNRYRRKSATDRIHYCLGVSGALLSTMIMIFFIVDSDASNAIASAVFFGGIALFCYAALLPTTVKVASAARFIVCVLMFAVAVPLMIGGLIAAS